MSTATALTYQGKTASEWRAKAQEARRVSAASFENSDTEGFVSQRANDSLALQYDDNARLAENGGRWTFPYPADLDGNLMPNARLVETQYGWSWVWDGSDGRPVWFRASSARKAATRRANNARKGVVMAMVEADAESRLSGSWSVYFEPAKRNLSADPSASVVGEWETEDYSL